MDCGVFIDKVPVGLIYGLRHRIDWRKMDWVVVCVTDNSPLAKPLP